MGDKGFEGGFSHGGNEPFYPPPADGSTPARARRAARRCRGAAHRARGRSRPSGTSRQGDQTLLGFEVTLEQGRGPVRGLPVATTSTVDGRKLPHRIEVRYGNETYGVLTVNELQAGGSQVKPVDSRRFADACKPATTHATRMQSTDDPMRPRPALAARRWPALPRCPRRGRRSPRSADEVNKKMVKLFGSGGFRGLAVLRHRHPRLAGRLHPDRHQPHPRHAGPARPPVRRPALPRQGRRHRAGAGRGPAQDRGKVDDLPYFDVAEAAKRPLAEPGDWVLALQQPVPDRHARRADVGAARRDRRLRQAARPARHLRGPLPPATSTSSTPSPTTPAPPAAPSPRARASCSASSARSCATA